GALMLVEIFHNREALHRLHGEVAVGHGMTDHDRLAPFAAQFGSHHSSDGALAAAGAHGADRDHGHGRFELGTFHPEQPEVGARGHHARSQMHQVLMENVTVGED